uniref:Uncharacterized protein n=1 Tax=Alexandrium catenella TaxID=2925 RepID=A0A7S1WN35_ALECA
MADLSVLADAAAEAGLRRSEALEVLGSNRFGDELEKEVEHFSKDACDALGHGGFAGVIPLFVFRTTNPNSKHEEPLQLSGSVPQEDFESVLAMLENLEMQDMSPRD